jgi:hypothetical protein
LIDSEAHIDEAGDVISGDRDDMPGEDDSGAARHIQKRCCGIGIGQCGRGLRALRKAWSGREQEPDRNLPTTPTPSSKHADLQSFTLTFVMGSGLVPGCVDSLQCGAQICG